MRESKAVNQLFEFLRSKGVNFDAFGSGDLEIVKAALNEKECILWINNHASLKPVFINNFGKDYYGFDSNDLTQTGFELYEKFLDPDHFDDVHNTIAFFAKHPFDVHRMTYRVRNRDNHWKWTYSLAKALNHNNLRKPVYVLAVVFDIESMVDGVLDLKLSNKNKLEEIEIMKRLGSLTKRETEVLQLIASENTSQKIGEKLFIEASTVDTHRKNIIRKLGVKSSIGLVRYALAER